MKVLIPMMGMGRAGGERVLAKLANHLCEVGDEVFITVPESNAIPYYNLDPKISILKTKVKKSKFKFVNFLFNIIYLINVSRKLNVDVAVANYNLTAFIVLFLQSSVRKFYYIQANEIKHPKNPTLKLLAFISYLLPLKKIVNSKDLLPSFINNYIDVLAPGIDLELFSKKTNLISDGKFNIGFIGRKESYKGSEQIIDTLSILLKDRKFSEMINVNVAVHFDEMWKSKINQIHHFTISNDSDLAEFYSKNQLIIATGLIEDGAFHYPCAEAIASKCLVISNYAPLAKSNSRLKIEKFDTNQLLERIKICINMDDMERNIEIQSNYKLVEEFSWTAVGQKFRNILKSR